MFTEEDLKPFSLWKHKKGGFYLVLGASAVCSTNGERDRKERSVVYYSLTKEEWNYREVSEFLDGRFTPATWAELSDNKKG